jgi:hypothetical protein
MDQLLGHSMVRRRAMKRGLFCLYAIYERARFFFSIQTRAVPLSAAEQNYIPFRYKSYRLSLLGPHTSAVTEVPQNDEAVPRTPQVTHLDVPLLEFIQFFFP